MTKLASGILITGTDTGVGKTTVASLFIEALAAREKKVAVLKPVESGCSPDGSGGLLAADGEALRRVSSSQQKSEEVVLYKFKNPVAPAVAERAEEVEISLERIIAHVESQRQGRDYLVVEGAGGLLVPIHGTYSFGDLAEECELSVLVVVGSRLGAINHAALTFEVLRARRLPIIGYVLSEPYAREVGLDVVTAAETNREIIQKVAARYDVPELGAIPHLPPLTDPATILGHDLLPKLGGELKTTVQGELARLVDGVERFFSE